MLKVRIIPVLLSRRGLLVKGRGFAGDRVIGQVRQAARVHERREVDELVVLDIGATADGRGPDFKLVESIAGSSPLTVGGGVRSIDDARGLMLSGADKIVVGAASHRAGFMDELATRFGSQAIVASIDVKGDEVFTNNGTVPTGRDPVSWARDVVSMGAGEILLCSIERDGTMQGLDHGLIERVTGAVTVPVVACGGCSGAEDMAQAIRVGAHAVAAGALYQFSAATPRFLAEQLSEAGIPTRITR